MTSTAPETDFLTALTDEELRIAADNFGTKKGLRGVMMKDLRENGVDQAQYNAMFSVKTEDVAPATVVVEPVAPVEELVEYETEEPVLDLSSTVQAAAPAPILPSADYLIKMDKRENPSFEFKNYKFTKEFPYQIMPARDAQAILSQEEGFRQAFPDELTEFFA